MDNNQTEGSSTPKRLSQTERAFDLAGDNHQMLADSISLLEEKLKPLLRNAIPKVNSEGQEEESFAAIPEMIRKLGYNFAFVNSRIRDLLERLEI